MNDVKFAIESDAIVDIVTGQGAATATNRITVDSKPICYAYREKPFNDIDTGWRFFAGDESDEYLAISRNTHIFDLNTIANYDPAILSIIDHPVGSAFEREIDKDWTTVIER